MNNKNLQTELDIVNGNAWRNFCDELKSLADIITREDTPNDSFNRAEGFAT